MRPTVRVTSHGHPKNQIATTSFVHTALRGETRYFAHIDELAFFPTAESKSFWKMADLDLTARKLRLLGISPCFLSNEPETEAPHYW